LEMGTRYSTFDASIKGMDGSYNSDRADKSVWSNSIGVVWRPQEHSSHYFNLSESFKPNWGTDQNNNFFDPRETRQIEAGIRYRLDEGRWNIESAIYQLTQKNLLKRDPEDREYWVLAGERRSQGLEFLLQYLPSQSFSIAASYSFIDAKYIGQDSRNQDNTPASIPKHSGAIRLNYTPLAIPAWRFFSGIKAIDGRFGDDANSFSVPGYALLDLGTHYSRKNLTLSFNITNALDKRYIAASFSDSDIYQGNRRQVRLSVEYRL
ncbi:MAG TPA: TonB-dependent receptor, partial [Gammaproteobacteria bacterium]|nr:TonB-dependent receptor [Gammaproteobacteria bacterium]